MQINAFESHCPLLLLLTFAHMNIISWHSEPAMLAQSPSGALLGSLGTWWPGDVKVVHRAELNIVTAVCVSYTFIYLGHVMVLGGRKEQGMMGEEVGLWCQLKLWLPTIIKNKMIEIERLYCSFLRVCRFISRQYCALALSKWPYLIPNNILQDFLMANFNWTGNFISNGFCGSIHSIEWLQGRFGVLFIASWNRSRWLVLRTVMVNWKLKISFIPSRSLSCWRVVVFESQTVILSGRSELFYFQPRLNWGSLMRERWESRFN